jgi:hypothetical protein
MRQHGASPHEIETSVEIQTEMAREWRAEVLREVSETFFNMPALPHATAQKKNKTCHQNKSGGGPTNV